METDCTHHDSAAPEAETGATAPESAPTPLPRGTRLLHIGPHKTGTTSIQSALFAAKDAMAGHGVDFPAHSRHPMEAVLAVCARPGMMGDARPTERHWQRLVDAVHATGRRTSVVSSEFFADAPDDEAIARIVDDLGRGQGRGQSRVHVLVTLRPLARIMPSQWQQYVQNGLRMGYEDWLEHMLRKAPYEKPNPSFWRRHRHDRLVERWVRVVGAENVTVVVVDDRDRDGLMRTFESLLGLPDGLLVPVPDTANRSLTLAETEMLRKLNREFRGNGLPDEVYSRMVRGGAVMHMKNACRPAPDDARIITPRWALEAAAGIGAEMAGRIAAMGVRVLGDPALLSVVPSVASVEETGPPRIDPEVAAHALYGALAVAAATPAYPPVSVRSVHQTPSRELVRVLGHRVLKRLKRA
ncbi:hypothetical protein [Streptomyces olivochromogenes]|uniref:Sulfotransferase family protein n=1 Tax=Streptomyces olivochromogenes TaxID=1963 RepID=A0A250V7Z0_STROL|nr:hypothetical protein [Streptomyces olivochromogenes]KUN45862.1 hypothetical protein AQJ27_18995 [Streptomyces olivochromogenes]GAX50136.1 hypothetical protein SO3561_01631 [Streptomyces olivochromogenes]